MRRLISLSGLLCVACAADPSADGTSGAESSDGTVGSGASETGATDATTAADSDSTDATGDGDDTTAGDGDGDGTTGGDGDGTGGDGDGTGDGDGSTGDGTAGDGDGDGTSTGDGDGDGTTAGDGDGDGTSTGGDGDGDGACFECSITLSTQASGTLEPMAGNTFLAEIYQGADMVWAMDEVGAGRLIASADSNILNLEMTGCPLYEWLGQSGTQLPRLAAIGSGSTCLGAGNDLPSYPTFEYLGLHVPPPYLNDPAALRADYDIVVYCPLRFWFDNELMDPADASTLRDYVTSAGGGLYLASDYFPGGLDQQAYDDINAIGNPLGVNYIPTQLDWGQATGDVMISCFPEPQ